ncbi:hypothetical protein M885DRAFT_514683 [Pelagophyceae sp. CCMP2097]|nr:hypothetical protein M885DRAFT_514683 [Pelagophyceae sp. CCMP2097]|mmetsp:Transcript_31800/g.107120  ORF Transcript_31800/g.107120 Transcript_31800/m.107120 type:complete len:229 (-) Transcript_31800:75-761(-)
MANNFDDWGSDEDDDAPPRRRLPPKSRRSSTSSLESLRASCLDRIQKERAGRVWRSRSAAAAANEDFGSGARRVLREALAESWGGEDVSPDEEAELVAELEAELRAAQCESFTKQCDREARALEERAAEYEADEACPSDIVLCPVCGGGYLAQSQTDYAIRCPACALTLDDHFDGLGLPHLRLLLANAYEEHGSCPGTLLFSAGAPFATHVTALSACCGTCAYRTVVM